MNALRALNIFSYLYDKTLSWSAHHHAPYYLAGVSFAESSFFPIPPDVMLISMGLASPHRAWYFAFIATLFSVLGGLFGYVIGHFGMHLIEPYLMASSYQENYHHIRHWFNEYGIWIILIAGFTPVPYKLFTITAGAMHLALVPFLLASFAGRGMRFFLVSGILYFMGERLFSRLRQYIDFLGWSILLMLVFAYLLTRY